MNYRFMRIIVMFDLPVDTDADRRNYRNFRMFLIKNGYIMLQESVYTRLAVNSSVAEQYRGKLRKVVPPDGLVQMLTVTEKQFQDMETLLGKNLSVYEDSDARLIIL